MKMKTNNIIIRLVSCLLLLPLLTISQTVNTGEVVVTPGTTLSTVSDLNNTATGTIINDGDVYAYSHWRNDGVVDHNNSGITRFVGVSPQIISGNTISYLYDALFDNEANQTAFELSGDVSIANEVNFDEGIIDSNNQGASFTFEQFAEHINTSEDSHVDGPVIKIGDNTFDYPIGDKGFYRYAEISAPDATSDTFSGTYTFENPDTEFPLINRAGVIELIDNQEYWTITNDSGDSNILLTLSWDENTTTPEEIVKSPETAIHIVRWDEGQQLWKDEGGVVDVASKTVTTNYFLEEYGVFTLARVKEDLVLPGGIVISNGVSPNGDGVNDYFQIDKIQNLANNKVEIFDRYGKKIFSTTNYDTNGNVFEGISDANLTIGNGLLPTGTYFYVLSYDFDDGSTIQRIKNAGYLYLITD